MELGTHMLLKVMTKEMSGKYKKIKKVSYQGNSDKNMLHRQQFVYVFNNIDLKRKTIINIDETWLGMTDFRQMHWTFPGLPSSVPKKLMSPRVSMIAALDTSGRVFLSIDLEQLPSVHSLRGSLCFGPSPSSFLLSLFSLHRLLC